MLFKIYQLFEVTIDKIPKDKSMLLITRKYAINPSYLCY